MQKLFSLLLLSLISISLLAQRADEKALKKRLQADKIVWDEGNGDGVFLARKKKTQKWGMFQLSWEGSNPTDHKVLVAAKYDSLGFFGFNGSYAIAKRGTRYGTVSSPWMEENELSKPLLPFKYEYLTHVKDYSGYLAAKLNGKYSYIDPENGKAYLPYVFESLEQLPVPSSYMKKYPMDSIPQKVMEVMKNPEKPTEIDFHGLGLTFLPKEIARCKNLKVLNLERNFLAEVPQEIAQLTQLEELYLGSNPGIDHIGPIISKLTNLKVLYIGKRVLYGTTTYSTESIEFDAILAQLTSLEELGILNYFHSDIPEFIYQLPSLKELTLEGIYLNVDFPKLDLSKMSCKDSLRKLNISFISDFRTFNDNISDFTQLERVVLETAGSETAPRALIMHPKVRYLKLIGYLQNESSNRYTGDEIIYFNRSEDDLPTAEERAKALKDWEAYMEKVKASKTEE